MFTLNKVLYVSSDSYIHCEHETFIISTAQKDKVKIPAAIIQQIIIFGNATISAFFVSYCSEHKILVSYVSPFGKYYGSIHGTQVGNIILRHKQHLLYEQDKRSEIVKSFVLGKIVNAGEQIKSALTNADEKDEEVMRRKLSRMGALIADLKETHDVAVIRGIEGQASSEYFSVFDRMLKTHDDTMKFEKRSKYPPENNCNAVLSLLYTLLTLNCAAALQTFGLDPYLGYLHTMQPGRLSLACDLVEEFRAAFVDHFVIAAINRKQIKAQDFERFGEQIKLKDDARKNILKMWQDYLEEKETFPLQNKCYPRKYFVYLQAQLLAETIREDIQDYPPYIWRL